VPGECFPTRYRSSSHGISAAAGKLGSIIAQAGIAPLRTRGVITSGPKKTSSAPWLNHIMQIFSLFMLCGIFTTLLIPETKRKTLEDLAGEYDMGAEDLHAEAVAAGKAGPSDRVAESSDHSV
jgi:PHS family inorganic phosphate transporter-like MFS transporter